MVVERVSIISYGEICFDIQVLCITSMFLEQILLANQGFTVFKFESHSCINVRAAVIYADMNSHEFLALMTLQLSGIC